MKAVIKQLRTGIDIKTVNMPDEALVDLRHLAKLLMEEYTESQLNVELSPVGDHNITVTRQGHKVCTHRFNIIYATDHHHC